MKTQASIQNEQDFKVKELVIKFLQQKDDWAKHIHHNCKCQKCNCGKHLCKFQSVQLDLKPTNTTYNHDYAPKKRLKSQCFSKPSSSHGKIIPITRGTTYKQDYPAKKGQYYSVSQKKSNNLKVGGPSFTNTTYGQSYTPFQSSKKEQPLKNPNNIVLTGARMKSKSNYGNTYLWKPNIFASQYKAQKRADNLRIDRRAPFQSQTSYNNSFNKANAKNICPKQTFAPQNVYIPEKTIPTKTAYQDNFNEKTFSLCPAAVSD